MNAKRVAIKYHNRQMFLTVDLNDLFEALFDAYGDDAHVEIMEMNQQEKNDSIDVTDGIRLMRDRFILVESIPGSLHNRREDLEQAILNRGRI